MMVEVIDKLMVDPYQGEHLLKLIFILLQGFLEVECLWESVDAVDSLVLVKARVHMLAADLEDFQVDLGVLCLQQWLSQLLFLSFKVKMGLLLALK